MKGIHYMVLAGTFILIFIIGGTVLTLVTSTAETLGLELGIPSMSAEHEKLKYAFGFIIVNVVAVLVIFMFQKKKKAKYDEEDYMWRGERTEIGRRRL